MSLLGSSQGIRLAPLSSERARAVSLMDDIGSSGLVIFLFNVPVYFWIWMSPDSLMMGRQGKEKSEERVIRELCCQPIFSCLHLCGGKKTQGMKWRPLAQLGDSCTLCATRKTKTYQTVNITWFITLVNFSSLFSCLALWSTKGNASPDKLGIMTFWAGQLLVPETPNFFFLPLSGFPLCSFFQLLRHPLGQRLPILCSVFSQHLLHFSQLGDLRFGESK